MVCHDLLLAPVFVDDCVLLDHGRIRSLGSAKEVFTAGNLRDVFGCGMEIERRDRNSVNAKWL